MFKILFNILLIGAAAGIFFLPTYGISAKYEDIKSVQAEIKQYAEANESAKKLAAKLDELINKNNSISPAQQARLVTFLPDNIDPIRFILEMESIGRKLGMPVRGARYTAVKTNNTTQDTVAVGDAKNGIFTFEFTTEGSYDNLVKMLSALNNSLRLIDVTSMTITPGGAGGDATRAADYYTYNIKLTAYWLK
jgi:hypothetical protein